MVGWLIKLKQHNVALLSNRGLCWLVCLPGSVPHYLQQIQQIQRVNDKKMIIRPTEEGDGHSEQSDNVTVISCERSRERVFIHLLDCGSVVEDRLVSQRGERTRSEHQGLAAGRSSEQIRFNQQS